MYLEAAAARPVGFGISPIPWAELAAWAQLRGVRLAPWEWGCIRSLDMAVVSLMAKLMKKQSGAKS